MGERAAAPAPVGPERPAWGGGDWCLAALLVGLLVGALGWSPGAFRPLASSEVEVLLDIFDESSETPESDAENRRRAIAQWPVAAESFTADRETPPATTGGRLYTLMLSAVVALLPRSGAAVLNLLLLATAALATARALRGRLGGLAGGWVALGVGATVAFAHVCRVGPEMLSLALSAVGLALVVRGSEPRVGGADEIYDPEGAAPAVGRWALSGLLLGLAAASSPALLPLSVAAIAVPAADRRRRAAPAILGGLVAGLGLGLALGGSPLLELAERLPALGDVGLWRANLLYLVAGGRGLFAQFPALVLLPLLWVPGGGRWAIASGATIGALAVLALSPHGWATEQGRQLLPLLPAGWFLAGRPCRRGWVLLPALLAVPLLLPLWLSPRRGGTDVATWARPVTALRAHLLYETTQRPEPEEHEQLWHGLTLRTLSPSIWPTAGGALSWLGGQPAGLLLAAPQRPLRLSLRFGEEAPTDLVVRGARLESTLLTPDGGVEFRLVLDPPVARHREWDGGRRQDYVHLYLAMPGAPMRPLEAALGVELE